MNCDTALQAMLEADRESLRGVRGGPLAEHLRSCSRCARTAVRLLDDELRLAAHLGRAGRGPSPDRVDEILRLVALPLAAQGASPRLHQLRVRRLWWGAAAAAAAVGALLLRSGAPRVALPTPEAQPVGGSEVAAPHVVPPEGRNAAVIQTSNPSITVVWLFQGADR